MPILSPLRALALASVLGLACASPIALPPVQGPGAVFENLDDAAVDALAYAHHLAVSSDRNELMHGGVLRAVAGGFSYDQVTTALPEAPNRILLVLRSDAVAHFRTYPPTDSARADRSNERVSHVDRQNVDEVDPHHRPAYVLTPSLVVRVYRGEGQRMARIARLRGGASGTLTARAKPLY